MHVGLHSSIVRDGLFFKLIMSKRKATTNVGNAQSTKKSHWALGLLEAMKDPELKVREDEHVVVIKDKFPKAEYHYLILPKKRIPSIVNLAKEDEELLRHMEQVGKQMTKLHVHREFKIGYHASPNMHQLHLHVISTDFNSPCLKTKVHWNSFTSPFFKTSEEIRQEMCNNGKIAKMKCEECDEYLKQPLKCHKCSFTPKNMPELKKHILSHIHQKQT